jgi:type 1 glutamine amidotransferase
MGSYASHPSRLRARSVPGAETLPSDLNRWCDKIESEENSRYPVDQSDGGEDDDLEEHEQWAKTLEREGRNPKLPWRQQIPTIEIDGGNDYISDSGSEVWNILESKNIKHILICGVHTNMCVLGRPFGLRQLASHGKHVVLLRDLTDTMYNPKQWPYVDHFSGTDLVVDHVERYVCSTTTSDYFFRGTDRDQPVRYLTPHVFSGDRRPHLAILMAEDEYRTASTLPDFAAAHLASQLKISLIYGKADSENSIPGLAAIDDADALLVSVRRRPLLKEDMDRIRRFLESGRPVIGIRTASHAFCLRDNKTVNGLEQWPEFDAYAFGGSYSNHFANDLIATITPSHGNSTLMLSKGSLYQVSPLLAGTQVIWEGKVDGANTEPVAWTFVRKDGGASFYTSLGHPSDFDENAFRTLLVNAILGACKLEPVTPIKIQQQRQRYEQGQGRQRK